jgi:hypothetical protein
MATYRQKLFIAHLERGLADLKAAAARTSAPGWSTEAVDPKEAEAHFNRLGEKVKALVGLVSDEEHGAHIFSLLLTAGEEVREADEYR